MTRSTPPWPGRLRPAPRSSPTPWRSRGATWRPSRTRTGTCGRSSTTTESRQERQDLGAEPFDLLAGHRRAHPGHVDAQVQAGRTRRLERGPEVGGQLRGVVAAQEAVVPPVLLGGGRRVRAVDLGLAVERLPGRVAQPD